MTDILKIGSPEMVVGLRRNKRAKRLTLRVSSVDGKPVLTLPPRVTLRAAQDFLMRQEKWLRERLSDAPTRVKVDIGVIIPFCGEKLVISQHSKTRTVLAPGHIVVSANKHAGKSVSAFLKSRARLAATEHAQKYAAILGHEFNRISIRDPRSRWGSCSTEGNLMFSWRLVLAPEKVLEYVVAHEIAHLAEMNHSAAFWQTVAGLMPEYNQFQKWLKLNGATLHRLDFNAALTRPQNVIT